MMSTVSQFRDLQPANIANNPPTQSTNDWDRPTHATQEHH